MYIYYNCSIARCAALFLLSYILSCSYNSSQFFFLFFFFGLFYIQDEKQHPSFSHTMQHCRSSFRFRFLRHSLFILQLQVWLFSPRSNISYMEHLLKDGGDLDSMDRSLLDYGQNKVLLNQQQQVDLGISLLLLLSIHDMNNVIKN